MKCESRPSGSTNSSDSRAPSDGGGSARHEFTRVSPSTIYDLSWRSHKLFLEAHPVWRFRVDFDVNLHEAITLHGQFDLRWWGEE